MDAFVAWNLRLLQAFFSPASRGDEVWLAINPEELDAIGPDLGGDQGLLDAVRNGPPWPTIKGAGPRFVGRGLPALLAERARGLVTQRQIPPLRPVGYMDPGAICADYEGCDAPTYLPCLAALVRCAAVQDEHGYYAVLRRNLGLPPAWYTSELASMESLWSDLDLWSRANGSLFGRFVFRQLGGFRYVGVPRSQSIVSRRDVSALPRVFAQAGVRPGQRVSDPLLDDIRRIAADAPFLSRPFRDALADDDFEAPVRERLRALLEDWDGVVDDAARPRATAGAEQFDAGDDVEVALGLAPGNVTPWQVRWRVPALRDVGVIQLKAGGNCWTALFAGTEVIDTMPAAADADRLAATELLARSEREDVEFEAVLGERSFLLAPFAGALLLRRRILRSFVADREDTNGAGQVVLHEHPLPAHGGAYLLATGGNAQRLQYFLRRNEIVCEPCPVDGLPAGWLLVHLPECAQLQDSHRNEFPDGEAARSQPRVVRLVGGRPIQRAGLRQYLAYDLPFVELDAPPSTQLRAVGLQLTERFRAEVPPDDVAASGPLGRTSALRRFDISVLEGKARSFRIEAIYGGGCEGTATLRLAPGGGLETVVGEAFSLDPQGNPQRDGEGLLGVLSRGAVASHAHTPAVHVRLGRPVDSRDATWVAGFVAAKFLDSLAQLGSVHYGAARDQLRRLITTDSRVGSEEPLDILRELRSRGHLEIETDAKGRWVRIHAVPPVLCVLPVVTPGGSVVAAMSGTLRQQHWGEVCSAREHGGVAYQELLGGPPPILPAIRVAVESAEALPGVAQALGCTLARDPARQIAHWAACLDAVQVALEALGVESLGSGSHAIERFLAAQGLFTISRQGGALDTEPHYQLLRMEDAETGRHQLYSLGFHDAHGKARYTFVRDSRWGVWLALVAFAEFARRSYRIADASPWPFQYCQREHTLWLPARINLPVVLERALVLCSGDRPLRARVCGRPRGDMLMLEHWADGREIGAVSLVYDQFAPRHDRWATWLGYRWVPEDIAMAVAGKLGGRVHYLVR